MLDSEWVESIRLSLPELPEAKMQRFFDQYELKHQEARLLTSERALADYFEAVVTQSKSPARTVSSWIAGEFMRYLNDFNIDIASIPVPAEALAQLIDMVTDKVISGNSGKVVLDGSDGDQGTVPQYVTDLAGYLDHSWTEAVTNMGYTAPPSDGTAGGDGRLDVYLVDMNALGYTSFDSGPSDVYIVIENDFEGFPENLDPEDQRQGALKVTAAHEFFHASQFQHTTNIFANGWWMEATGTWLEDIIYPEVKDYLNYTGFKYDDSDDDGKWDSGETWYKIDGVTSAGTTSRDFGISFAQSPTNRRVLPDFRHPTAAGATL